MTPDLSTIPEGYRGMFYPPIVHQLDLSDVVEFDFKAYSEEVKKRIEQMHQAFFLGLFGDKLAEEKKKSPEEEILQNLKWAYIVENGKRFITYVDNKTEKAYRLHDNSYYDGLLWPLEEITNFTFDRWCRGMDL